MMSRLTVEDSASAWKAWMNLGEAMLGGHSPGVVLD
jgi:hypothetical protein